MTSVTDPAVAPPLVRPAASAGDFWGGLAAMLVAFPSAIAYGVVVFSAVSPGLSSEGALAGIIGAAVLGLVAPLVGRNGGFITAPCAPAAAVLSGLAAQLSLPGTIGSGRIVALLGLTALLSAALQILYGTVRAGRLIKYIPFQVVTGYLSGVAVIIAAAQLPKLIGAAPHTGAVETLLSPSSWNWIGLLVGAVTILAMTLAKRVTKLVPGAIIGLTSGLAVYFAIAAFVPSLRRTAGNPLVIGPIGAAGSLFRSVVEHLTGLLSFTPADLALIVAPALTLSVLLSIDTLKTGVVLDAMTHHRHDSNRELIGQGVANVASFFAGGMPGAGTMGPTLVNVTSGGRSLWSGAIEGMLVLLAALLLGPLVAWVPIAALAGILLVVAFRMFDFSMFRLLLMPSARLDFFIIAAVIVTAGTVGLIEAALVGVCLAILLFIRNQIRGSVVARKISLREMRSKRRRSSAEVAILEERGEEGLMVQLHDDLFFGTTDQLFGDLEQDLLTRRFILFDFRRVQSMDYTAVHLFLQMQERLVSRGGQLVFSGMPSTLPTRQDIAHYMAQLGLVGATGIRVFDIRNAALEWMEEQILAGAGWTAHDSDAPLQLGEVTVLNRLDRTLHEHLAQSVRTLSAPAGTRIFAAGDQSDEIYIVRSGRIDVLLPLGTGKRHHLATFGRGEFFGELGFLDRRPRSADAEAATHAELFVLSRAEFERLTTTDDRLAARLFERLAVAIAQRLRVTDAELQALEER